MPAINPTSLNPVAPPAVACIAHVPAAPVPYQRQCYRCAGREISRDRRSCLGTSFRIELNILCGVGLNALKARIHILNGSFGKNDFTNDDPQLAISMKAAGPARTCHVPKIEQTVKDNFVSAHTFRFITPAETEQSGISNPCTHVSRRQADALDQ
jgi:hypothetical protein